jgi:hypothetical protein
MLYSKKTTAPIPFTKLSDSFDFDLEMIVMAHTGHLRIAEVAIPTIYAGEVSHLRPLQYGLRVLNIVAGQAGKIQPAVKWRAANCPGWSVPAARTS